MTHTLIDITHDSEIGVDYVTITRGSVDVSTPRMWIRRDMGIDIQCDMIVDHIWETFDGIDDSEISAIVERVHNSLTLARRGEEGGR